MMKTIRQPFLLSALFLPLFLGATASHAAAPKASHASKTEYAVVQVGTDLDIRIIESKDIQSLKKTIDNEDKTAKQAYDSAKKTSEHPAKNKTKNKSKGPEVQAAPHGNADSLNVDLSRKPEKRIVTILKSGFSTQKDAETWKQHYLSNPNSKTSKKDAA